MTQRKAFRVVALASAVALASLWPAVAHAQWRGRGGRGRAGVIVGGVYDPFFYSPFFGGYGWGRPLGFYGPYGPYLPYGGHAPYGPYAVEPTGAARILVTPKQTEVYVDGYRAGTADDFDGAFQRLRVSAGPHEVALYLRGYHVVRERLYLSEGKTMKIQHAMVHLAPGEPADPRPEPSAPSRRARGRTRAGDADRLEGGAAAEERP